jgi:hypothetical protein
VLLTISSAATPQPAGSGQVAIAGAASLSVAPSVHQPVIVTASLFSPYGAMHETISFTLWPGGAPVSLPDPGAGNVWVVAAITASRLEVLSVTSELLVIGVFGVAGWQIGSWIGEAIDRHRVMRGWGQRQSPA